MEDFQRVLYEAILVAFGKVLSKYNVFAQSSILRDVGGEIIGYLNSHGFGFDEKGDLEDLSKLTELFVKNGFAEKLDIEPADKGSNYIWHNLYGVDAYEELHRIADNPFLSCPLNLCLFYVADKQNKTMQLHKKSFDRVNNRVESQYEIVDKQRGRGEGFDALVIENARLYDHTMEQLRTLSHRLLEIQETERRYIARELHDEVGQALTALRIGLKRTEGCKTLESALASIRESTPTVEELINKVRNLSIELRPSILDDFGLTAALDWYVNWLSPKVGFKVAFRTDLTEERFSPILELTCFRITQEALTNAARHSNAKNVYVDLETMSGELHLTVRDDGKGFNIDETRKRALKGESFGLLGMQERASLAGGHLELTSAPGKGTAIHVYFPLESKAEGPVETSTDN
jgi:signal transduction histidine kinase